MSDALAGALCVFAAISAGASIRSRRAWQVALAVAAAIALSDGATATAAMLLALGAGFVSFRSARVASVLPASMQAFLVTLAFIAWRLPDVIEVNGAPAVLAGGALAAVLARRKGLRRESMVCAPLHLAAAGACAALAYAVGAQLGPLAILPVVAMIALIGAHLSLALGGDASAPVASPMSGVAACGLAIAEAGSGTNGALVVASVTLALACGQTSSFAGIARRTP